MTTDDLRDLLDGIPYPELAKAFNCSPQAIGNWHRGGSLTAHARFLTGLENLGWELRRKKNFAGGLDTTDDPAP